MILCIVLAIVPPHICDELPLHVVLLHCVSLKDPYVPYELSHEHIELMEIFF
jgi:hypothetical protein